MPATSPQLRYSTWRRWLVVNGLGWLLVSGYPLVLPAGVRAASSEFEIRIVDDQTGEPLAARMYLWKPNGKPHRVPRTVYWHDHFVVDRKIVLSLPVGQYRFRIERGGEYLEHTGHFVIRRGATDNQTIRLKRFVDMSQLGWWSGDLHVVRRAKEIDRLMRAEDLHVVGLANATTMAATTQLRTPDIDSTDRHVAMGLRDGRRGGWLTFLKLHEGLDRQASSEEYPASTDFLKSVLRRQPDAHISAADLGSWDLPVWLASGHLHSMTLLGPDIWQSGDRGTDPVGYPRDKLLFPDPHGYAEWTRAIYYRMLNCGLRIPPVAGSGSGIAPNPVGYHRVYVYAGGEFTEHGWWESLAAGQVVVTNGPIILPRVNGQLPGHVFHADAGETVELDIALTLHTRERISYLEIVRDGKVFEEIRLDQLVANNGRLPIIRFDSSGWLLIRAVTDNQSTHVSATTGPYYVEIDGQPRVERAAAQFFLDWARQRAENVDLPTGKQRQHVMRYHHAAIDYWTKKVNAANAE